MSINVKRTTSKPAQASTSKSSGSGKSSKSTPQASAKKTDNDSVSLTNTASTLQQIEQSLSDIPIVDSARVEAVSQSIEDGQYTIDNEKIADGIINNENAFQQRKK